MTDKTEAERLIIEYARAIDWYKESPKKTARRTKHPVDRQIEIQDQILELGRRLMKEQEDG